MDQPLTEREAGSAAPPFAASPILPLVRSWRAVSVRGALFTGLGLLLLTRGHELRSIAAVFAVFVASYGVLAAMSAFRAASRCERWGSLAVESLFDWTAAGAAALLPGTAGLTVGCVSAAMAALSGGAMVAVRGGLILGQAMMALAAGVSILFGALLAFVAREGAGDATAWLGAYAMVLGAALLVFGRELRLRRGLAGGTATLGR